MFAGLIRVILSIKAIFLGREETITYAIIHANELLFNVIRVKIKSLQYSRLLLSLSPFLSLSLYVS